MKFFFERGKKHDLNPRAISDALAILDGVADVQCSEEWLNNFTAIMDMVVLIGFIVGGAFVSLRCLYYDEYC